MPTEQKKPRELTVSAAVAKMKKLREEQAQATDEAVRSVTLRYADRQNAIIGRVHPSARKAVLTEAGFSLPECFEPIGEDVPPMTSDEIDEATAELPAGAREYVPGPVAQAATRGRG